MEKQEVMFVRLPRRLKDAGRSEAARRGLTLGAFVKLLLWQETTKNIDKPMKQEAVDDSQDI